MRIFIGKQLPIEISGAAGGFEPPSLDWTPSVEPLYY